MCFDGFNIVVPRMGKGVVVGGCCECGSTNYCIFFNVIVLVIDTCLFSLILSKIKKIKIWRKLAGQIMKN